MPLTLTSATWAYGRNEPMRTSTAHTPVRVIPMVAVTARALILGDEIGCHARRRERRECPRA